MIKISILPYKDRSFYIGTSIKHEDRVNMLLLLVQNLDVFTWSPYDVPKVDAEFITQKLNVDWAFPTKKQKLRRYLLGNMWRG